MITEDHLSELVGLIYDAAEQATAWPIVLEKIGEAVGGAPGAFAPDDRRNARTSLTVSVGLDPGALAQYAQHYHSVDLFVSAFRQCAFHPESSAR